MASTLQTVTAIDNSEIATSISTAIDKLPLEINNSILSVVTQNVRSIYCNIDDLVLNIRQFSFEIDIVILTECRIDQAKPIPSLTNYITYSSTNHINQSDGVVVFIRNGVQACVKEIILSGASCLQITTDCFTIIGIYRSPSNRYADQFIYSLNAHLESLKSQKNIIVTGDININIIQKPTEQTYERHNRVNYLNNLSFHGLLPGHCYPTRENSCIDHVMLKLERLKYDAFVAVLDTTTTDHSMELLAVSSNGNKDVNRNKSWINITKVNYEKALQSLLFQNLFEIECLSDPNIMTNLLIEKIGLALLENTKTVRISSNKRILKPWITSGILRCIRVRNGLQKKLRLNPNDNILRITYRRYRNFCNNLVKKLKREYYKSQLAKSTKNSKLLWKTVNEITNFKCSKTTSNSLLNLSSDRNDSVNSVNHYFAGIGQSLAEDILKNTQNYSVPKSFNSQPTSFVLLDTDPLEVESTIMSLNSNTAMGCDNVPMSFLKTSKHVMAPLIAKLINLCFAHGLFPDAFKKSIVTPVHKGGDRDDVGNYRPISVLTSLSKVMERLLNKRLLSFLNKYKLISESQYGFRKNVSTENAVRDLTSLIVTQVDKNKKCLTVFLDLKKAFDTVSVPILLQRLEDCGVRDNALSKTEPVISRTGNKQLKLAHW